MPETIADPAPTGDDVEAAGSPRAVRLRARLGRSMTPVLIALTAALIAVGVLGSQTFDAERAARDQAIHETDTLFALQQMLRTALDAETGQRGYLLTGDERYLAPYLLAQSRFAAQLAGIDALFAHAAGDERLRVRRLDAATREKMAELGRTVTLARAGRRDAALDVVKTGFGRERMLAIRAEVTALSVAEERKRDQAFARVRDVEARVMLLASLLVLAMIALVGIGFRGERVRARAAAEAEQAAALREAHARAQLLARELNHRVKNLFSVILAIVSLSGRKRGSTAEVVEDIRARIRALSLAHTVSQGDVSDDAVALSDIIARTMEPYREADRARVSIEGPEQTMTVRAVTPIGLIVHELATNAAKYGALSEPNGRVAIAWWVEQSPNGAKQLKISWIESGGPALSCSPDEPARAGYGSQMITLAANQLGGSVEREWPASGAVVRLTFPVD